MREVEFRFADQREKPLGGVEQHVHPQRERAFQLRWNGAIVGGRQYTPGYEIINKYSVLGDQTALQFGQGYNTPQIRANNALQYRAELKGFTLSLMYGFGGVDDYLAGISGPLELVRD